MVKRQGVANIVNKKTGQKYTLKSTNLDNLIKNYFESLENGTHSNDLLQSDFNKYGRDNFEVEIIVDNCSSEDEINRIGNKEIRKNASKSYNKRKSNESFSGGNEYAPNSAGTHEKLMEYLSQYINLNHLPHYYKEDLERKIDDKTITSKDELDDELAQKHKEYGELIEIIHGSDLPKDVRERMIKDIKKHKTTKENLIDIISKMKHLPPINTSVKKEVKSTSKSQNKDLIICPGCGELSDKTRNFCKVCGINLKISDDIICPECGRVLDEDETFCKVCGISLENINIMSCPNCSSKCHRSDMFCDSCGFPLNNLKCPYCGTAWDKNKTSCKNCGFSLENSDFVLCPKCSNICSKDENYCDFCGFEFKKPINVLIDNMQSYKSESENKSSYKKTSQKNNKSSKKHKNHSFDQFLIDTFGSILSVQKNGSPPRLSFSKCMGFLFFSLSLLASILTIPVYKNPLMIIVFIFCGLIYYSIFRGIGAIVRIFKD